MNSRGESLDLLDGFDAPLNDLRAETRQRFIPDLELVAASSVFTQGFEQRVALTERLIVITEHARIRRNRLR